MTAPRSSTCSRARARRPVLGAAARAVRTSTRSAPIPGRLRIGLRTERPAIIAVTDDECVAAAEDAARLLESLGHHVEVAAPAAFDEVELLDLFTTIMFDVLCGRTSMKSRSSPAARSAPTTSSRSPGPSTRWAQDIDGDRLLDALHGAQRVDAAHAPVVDGRGGRRCRLRPAADADDGGTSRRPRRHGRDARRPVARARPRATPFAAYAAPFNVTGQPAISLPTSLDGRARPPDRRAARRVAPTVKTCSSASPRRSRRRGRGPTAAHRSAPERVTGVRVAGGQGFYGDTPRSRRASARRRRRLPVPRGARRAHARDPAEGPPARRDAGLHARPSRVSRPRRCPTSPTGRTKVITNAGGINPTAAARAADRDRARRWASPASRSRPSSATTSLPRARRRHAAGDRSRTSTPARRSTRFPGPALFASAYLGARPIADALAQGADIVITGRCRRRGAVPRRRSSTSTAGHGTTGTGSRPGIARRPPARVLRSEPRAGTTPATGGRLPHPWDLPYPIADVDADGTAIDHASPRASGGRVSFDTVRHQLLYEVHDPARYLTPDVVADFTQRALRGPRRRPRPRHRRARHAGDRHLQGAARAPRRAGRARPAWRSRGPTRRRRRRRPRRSSRSGSRWPASPSTSGASSTGASTRSAARPSRADDACEPPECRRCASRGGATTSARLRSSAGSSCRSRCRRRRPG